MPHIVKNRIRYWVVSTYCIGCACLELGSYQHRGATNSGSRNTGQDSQMCLRNAYRGCPTDTGYSREIAVERRKNGLKVKP